MSERHIRVSARGLIRRKKGHRDDHPENSPHENNSGENSHHEDELLVAREYCPDDEPFYYPLGGGVEFGEHSEDALHREFDEELGVSLSNVSHFGTYEDVFVSGGRRHHELWCVSEADIVESWPYERDAFTGYEAETDEEIECVWKSSTAFSEADETFYPEPLVSNL